ncbi:MAG: phytoene desaturase family protein, partial [Balneolaceae bacterium]
MQTTDQFDAVVVGSGPNGLAAAIRLSLEGLSVKVIEAADTIGGGTRTKELTLPGLKHDICSAIHPMAASSPFLRKLPLEDFGLEWIQPDYPLAHPLDDQPAVIVHKDIDETARSLGSDAGTYQKLLKPLAENWESLTADILGPLSIPSHPFRLAGFGLKALQPATRLVKKFKTEQAAALFGGLAAHSILSLDKVTTSAIGLVLGAAAHAVGWPLPKGGSQSIADAMGNYLKSLGGEIETGTVITCMDDLPLARVILFDLTPGQVLKIAGKRLPAGYIKKLKAFRYGAGVFKIDYALSRQVPWKDGRCKLAGTVHLGGSFSEIAASEKEISIGKNSQKPYVLIAQQSNFDRSRTEDHKETLWAYCHVPNGSTLDMTKAIENQIERFAPGFKEIIIKRHTMNTAQIEAYNSNYIGGDINGGAQDVWQLFSRPVSMVNPYGTPASGIYFCSSSTPPGGGVHG